MGRNVLRKPAKGNERAEAAVQIWLHDRARSQTKPSCPSGIPARTIESYQQRYRWAERSCGMPRVEAEDLAGLARVRLRHAAPGILQLLLQIICTPARQRVGSGRDEGTGWPDRPADSLLSLACARPDLYMLPARPRVTGMLCQSRDHVIRDNVPPQEVTGAD
jgi:hypothetical protein